MDEAFLQVAHEPPSAGGVSFKKYDGGIAELVPPMDLQRRLSYLPQDYVEYRQVRERFQLATTKPTGENQLTAAREGESEKSWPQAHYLGPLHPVTEWAAERALAGMSNKDLPAVLAKPGALNSPVVLVMGTLTNDSGQVISRAFVQASLAPIAAELAEAGFETKSIASIQPITGPVGFLRGLGIDEDAINPGGFTVPERIDEFVRASITQAETYMDVMRRQARDATEARAARWRERADAWAKQSGDPEAATLRGKPLADHEHELLQAASPKSQFVRPLLVILPSDSQKD